MTKYGIDRETKVYLKRKISLCITLHVHYMKRNWKRQKTPPGQWRWIVPKRKDMHIIYHFKKEHY